MKVPALFGVAFGLFLLLSTSVLSVAFQNSAPPSDDRRALALGTIMGRDFTTLMANPSVRLEVGESNGVATFVWTSENPARLTEVIELGEYMIRVKHLLEVSGPSAPESPYL